MMSERIVGYCLLFGGILIMVFSVIEIYLLFTNQIKPFPLFSSSGASINISSLLQKELGNNLPKNALGTLNQSQQNAPKIDLFSSDIINQSLNLTSEFFLMTFLTSFGYRLSMLGITLIRPIVVKLKTKEFLQGDHQ